MTDNPFRLTGRVALVTGASRGIGRAIALELGRAGAAVAVHHRASPNEADAVAGSIAQSVTLAADLRDPIACRGLIDECHATLGAPEILIHSAGIWNHRPVDDPDVERLNDLMALNLNALFHLASAAVPAMKERRHGRIIGISSTAALLGEPEHSHYAASKGAMESWARSLAVELGPFGITTNTVAPGWTLTEMVTAEVEPARLQAIAATIPTRRLATPEDVAHAVRFLVSDEARHINGACLPVEGGFRWRR
ncbi:MAG: SDR family oxidoreductase [Candidatus Eisenbacteria bacterium]|nr:SDR family oxidoreductase [Candidatus Eisenbacteria bacterium]